MAQKSKAATKRPSKVLNQSKPTVSPSKVKKTSGGKQAQAKAEVKTTATKVAKAPAAKAKAKVDASKPANIEQAKAALKKVTAAQAAEPSEAPKARVRRISIDIDPNEASSALAQKWSTLYKKAEQIESKAYNMRSVFEEKTAIVHKVLGWGYILANRNDRLEVLFKDGIKYLISNYKPL